MKQLILYFLFFVGAAFVFIQCAALFPSIEKAQGNHSKNKKTSGHSSPKAILESTGFIPVTMMDNANLGTGVFKSYFYPTALPLAMMQYIKGYSFLNNNYWGLYHDVNDRLVFYTPGINYTNNQMFNNNSLLQASNDIKK